MDKPEVWGIDGDVVAYAVSFKSQKEGDTLEDTLLATTAFLRSIINECGDEGIIYLTGNNNFRFKEATEAYPYKGHRKDSPKPAFLADVRQHMIDEFGAEVHDRQEADDALSIAACTKGHGIATIDKDLDGCYGWHYNWQKQKVYYVTEDEANQFFYTQLITGDATDNIPGLFKRTGQKAMAALKDPIKETTDVAEMYDWVHKVYMNAVEDRGMSSTKEDVDRWLLSQGRCLWMRRKEDEMWEPPSGT